MNKLNMELNEKKDIELLMQLFPRYVSDGKFDFDLLKQELADYSIDESKEKYQLTWPGKKEAIVTGNKKTKNTLRPLKDKSVDFDNTKNIYIEGDNLETLKILQESYLNKIKCIYIDPPYNTGNDFIYNDDFAKATLDELYDSGEIDEFGNRLITNSISNGRFHSDWLSMMYPRLKLARNLLSEDGFIFISIDDTEVNNLRKICDEIFGEFNFVVQFCVSSNSEKNNSKLVSISHEYILCYARNKYSFNGTWKVKKNNIDEYLSRVKKLQSMNLSKDEIHEELLKIVKYPRFYDFDHYTNVDEKGVYRTSDAGGVKNGNTETNIIHPLTGKPCVKPSGGWRYKDDEIKRMIAEGIFEFGKDENTIPVPKRYLKDFMYQVPKSVLYFDVQGTTKWLKNINIPFDFPKSVDLLKYLFSVFDNDSIILDFFSGSATAAHAVMQLNAEDNGNRKYILVQIPELCSESSEAFKKGYKNICDLGETRIKKSAELIKEETKAEIDYGFRVYKVDSSNMKDVYYKPGEMGQMNLMEYLSNIKEDRTPEDLLTQVMLNLGLTLDLKIEEKTILSNKVFYVENNSLVACFDEQVDINIIDEICKCNPMKVVFKDISFKTDKDKINLEERIKKLSPDTEISIL